MKSWRCPPVPADFEYSERTLQMFDIASLTWSVSHSELLVRQSSFLYTKQLYSTLQYNLSATYSR